MSLSDETTADLDPRTQVEALLTRELSAAVGATAPLSGWASRLTDEILAIVSQGCATS